MSGLFEERVPDLGDFEDVTVVEVLVKPGDAVEVDTPLITLETDKATLDVPATRRGVVTAVALAAGDRVTQGALILRLQEAAGQEAAAATVAATAVPSTADVAALPTDESGIVRAGEPAADVVAQLVVLGAGPGGYTAAFRAADLGLDVVLVDRWPQLGGVCLNVGCIPSKALLHAARVIEDAGAMAEHGVTFGPPEIDLGKLREWKNGIVGRLTAGLTLLAKQRRVRVVRGFGRFLSRHRLGVEAPDGGTTVVGFEQCIIAVGSEPATLAGLPDDPRIVDSTGALALADAPERLLVVGGGIIGLEMACVYDALGSRVSVVELLPTLVPGCDRDLVKPLEKRIGARYERILTGTRVASVTPQPEGLHVAFSGAGDAVPGVYQRLLIAVGRIPNGARIAAAAAGVRVDERGFIAVDGQLRTSAAHVFAVGDVTGPPMLAHRASHQGKLAAEVAAGRKGAFDARAIPSVAYTDPEIAWVGTTETEARAAGRALGKGLFPWAASGRSLTLGRNEGFTKLLFDPETHRVVGGGIVGSNAGELIAEIALAVEMGADAADVGLTVHPHPTLSETVAFAAEAFEGTLTDLYTPRR